MAQNSKIEWTETTWNPVTGCTKISAGCTHCYAERMARRLAGRFGYPEAPHHFDVTLRPERLGEPLRWRKPRTVFVCSMSDLFHEDVPFEFVAEIIDVIEATPEHAYQILTKRPGRALEFTNWMRRENYDPSAGMMGFFDWPKNAWLGVTIEKPEYCYRSEDLRQIPAAVRFISFEPLLGSFADYPGVLDDIDWAIVGGESGPGARPMHPDWARSLRDQCQAAGVPFFFKQWGAWYPNDARHPGFAEMYEDGGDARHCLVGDMAFARVGKKRAGRLLDGRTWDKYPISSEDRQ